MKHELVFLTVIGKDKKGIVATISNFLYKQKINIEDISQKVFEGYFVMTMLIDVKDYSKPLQSLNSGLNKIEQKMNLKIQVQHENIFRTMHRI
jgi:ACT domain-containing protein